MEGISFTRLTYKLHHIGLLVSDKKVKSIQTSETTRTNSKAENVVFYPTRAVFGMDNEGVFRVDWAYSLNSNITYAYDIPADNKPGEDPKERPSASYPGKGTILNLREGIGAGPVLLKDGKIKNTWLQEIWDDIGGVNVNVDGPRTAIGVSDNKKLMFFVCEGRGRTPNVFGLTTEDVAQALLELSCIDAMSFDGGGSSCLLINGKEVIKPSDGTQRKIVTAIALN